MCVQRLTVETGGLNERQLTELQRTVKKYKGNITNSCCRRPNGSSGKSKMKPLLLSENI